MRFKALNADKRSALQRDVDDFLQNGGMIEKIPSKSTPYRAMPCCASMGYEGSDKVLNILNN